MKKADDGESKVEEIRALIARTDKENPQPEDVELLRRELDAKPEFYRRLGNLNRHVFSSLVTDAVSKSVLIRECAERYVEEMKTELGYQSSTFVEKMLIDEIIMRWLRLTTTEADHRNAIRQNNPSEQLYLEKRLDAAQKRYLRAIETLAKVRKMIAQTQMKGAKMFSNLLEPEKKNRSPKLIDEPAAFNEKPGV